MTSKKNHYRIDKAYEIYKTTAQSLPLELMSFRGSRVHAVIENDEENPAGFFCRKYLDLFG